jgi:hypothetical protein
MAIESYGTVVFCCSCDRASQTLVKVKNRPDATKYAVLLPQLNTRAHYFAYLSRYGHLKAEVINCTPDEGHVWCPKHVEAIKTAYFGASGWFFTFTAVSLYKHQLNKTQNIVLPHCTFGS